MHSRSMLLSWTILASMWTGGCLALVGLEDNYEVQAGDTSSAGCPDAECCPINECPQPDEICVVARCIDGRCTNEPAPNAWPWRTPEAGDCTLYICNEDGTWSRGVDTQDALDDGNECTADKCDDDGATQHIPADEGTPCSQDGGSQCNGEGRCVP